MLLLLKAHLIQKQDVGVLQQDASQRDSPPFAARQMSDGRVTCAQARAEDRQLLRTHGGIHTYEKAREQLCVEAGC
jgi:hypothetical protein